MQWSIFRSVKTLYKYLSFGYCRPYMHFLPMCSHQWLSPKPLTIMRMNMNLSQGRLF